MKKKIIILLIVCFVFFNYGLEGKEKVKISRKERKRILKNLNEKYKHWLNITTYISYKEEKDIFLSLKNNRDRDIFIKTFWQQRDPTAGTAQNEYKNEIEKRFLHVNKVFKRGATKPGWMTDMGKFYIILGKPNSIERFDSKAGLFPAQVWYYFGDKSLGLPTYFNITFFKPNNTTEWKLYDPLIDGPAALLIKTENYSGGDYAALYNKIYELAPTLAMPAVTMIPNEVAPGFRPNPRTNFIFSIIEESPKKKVNLSYATHFLNYRGFVDVESSVNYIANSNLVSITKYERFGFSFVNISLKPKEISVGYSEEKDQYYFSYLLSVNLKKDETFIYEYKKNFDLYIDPDKVNSLKGNGIVIHDSFPVIPGKYKLTVFMMNSVGKEFTYFDQDIIVPHPGQNPTLATPIVGYKSEVQPGNFFFSYKFNNKKLFIDTEKNLRLDEKPLVLVGIYNLKKASWENGRVELGLKGLDERNNFKKKYELLLNRYPYKKDSNILHLIGENEEALKPDYYELEIHLIDGAGNVMDKKTAEFSVSPIKSFSYAMEIFKMSRADNPYYFYHILGTQYEKTRDINNAKKYYKKSIQSNPQFPEGYVSYLNFLNKQKEYDKVLMEIKNLKEDDKFAFEYYLIKATAFFGKKDFNEALKQLLKANEIYDSDIRVLNLLGFTFLNLKNYKEGLKALEASLSLNEKQKFISKTVEEVKKIGKKNIAPESQR